jgi:hypothetical protein
MMPRLRTPWNLAAVALLVGGTALAEPYNIEAVGFERRSDADAVVARVEVDGLDAQVLRSFRKGRGWVFIVRVEGVEGRDLAASTARHLADTSGRSVQVYLVAGRDLLPVEELSIAAPSGSGDVVAAGSVPAAPTDGDALAEGEELLRAMVLAHGGGQAADQPQATLDSWERVHFSFQRSASLGGERFDTWHDYWRDGDKLRLEVKVLEGEGRSSTTIVHGDEGAWLFVDGELHEVPPGPTREALEAFVPGVVLEQACGLSAWTSGHRARRVQRSSAAELVWLVIEAREPSESVILGIEPTDHRVRELVLSEDVASLSWRFQDYQEVGEGLVLPLRLESMVGGELREQVTVRVLEAPPSVDSGLFDPEVPKTP